MDYVLGFDGGGTKTECVLMDAAGKILARSFSGPSNPWRVGVESATREIEKAADLSFEEARVARHVIVALGAGLAGTGNPELKERMHAALAGAFPGAAVSIFTDLEIALAAAGEGPVIVLVAGTGSAAIGRNAQGQIWRTGGQGPRFGYDGSAFDIGSRAVARAMKEREQHGKDSILGRKILEQLDYASWPELRERATLQPDNVFPSVFPIVAAAADAGDPAAREILAQAAGELSSLVHAVAEHSGHGRENIMIVKTGGTVGGCASRAARQSGDGRNTTLSAVGKKKPPLRNSRGGGAAQAIAQELPSEACTGFSSAHAAPDQPAPSPRPLFDGPRAGCDCARCFRGAEAQRRRSIARTPAATSPRPA